MARVDHRAAEDCRSIDQSHGTRRERTGRVPSGDSVAAWTRLFGQADHDRLGPCPDRACVDRADEAPRIHAICGARRRLGRFYHGADGSTGAARIDRYPHQHAGHRPSRDCEGAPVRRTAPFRLDFFYKHGLGYAQEMANRPQTLYGIEDSPVGLAAWMLDHDASSYALIARVFDGQREGLTRDDILDNVTLYWLTNTAISSARLYW